MRNVKGNNCSICDIALIEWVNLDGFFLISGLKIKGCYDNFICGFQFRLCLGCYNKYFKNKN